MATHAPITGAPTRATFIAKLLAPLPADEVPAADKRYIRQLKVDAGEAWRHSMRPVHVAQKRLEFIRAQQLLDNTVSDAAAFAAYVAEVDRQTAIPTIIKEAITWKRNHVAVGATREMRERREAFIAADIARAGAF